MRSRYFAKLVTVAGAAIASLALLAPAAQAAEELGPGYQQFAGCPSPEEDSTVETCLRSVVTSGHFQMGSKDVSITNPVVISGGVTEEEKFVFNSEGGLRPAKQLVPGGLVGLTGLDWLVNVLGLEALKVYATTEVAGTMGLPLADPFSLPIKVHLENPALGKNCYVGSTASPIQLSLTRGTTSPPPPNEPITGHEPELGENPVPNPNILFLTGASLVDNAFAAPAASGCRLELGLLNVPIDALVNIQSGLPSPAGTNETVQNANLEFVLPGTAYLP